MESVALTHVRIVREIHRMTWTQPDETKVKSNSATFSLEDGWLCCQAWIRDGAPQIYVSRLMTPEQAAVVEVAIGMALDWIGEELLK
jgi:hypothetical protein